MLKVSDFGTIYGDGIHDDALVIQAALNSMGAPGGAKGCKLIFDPVNHSCLSDIHIARQAILEGEGGADMNGGTTLTFSAGKQPIVHLLGSPVGGVGRPAIRDMQFETSLLDLVMWTPCTEVTAGTAYQLPGDNRFYLVAINDGTTGECQPVMPSDPEMSEPFVEGAPYFYGQTVRGSFEGETITGAVFEVSLPSALQPSENAGVEPIWNTTIGATTVSGGVTFTAKQPVSWTQDGSITSMCRVHAGIWMRSRALIHNVGIFGATNAGVEIRGNLGSVPPSEAGFWSLESPVHIVQCGRGLHVSGSDSGAGHAIGVYVESAGYGRPGNDGVGFDIAALVGAVSLINCKVANDPTNGGGHSYQTDSVTRTLIQDCYAEGYGGDPRVRNNIGGNTIVIGGNLAGAGFTASAHIEIGVGNDRGCRNMIGQTEVPDGRLWSYFGSQDGASVFRYTGANDLGAMGISRSDYLGLWPHGWWTDAHNANGYEISRAWSGEGAKLPSGVSVPWAQWFPKGVYLGGYPQGTVDAHDPQMLTSGTEAPTTGYHTRGSIRTNSQPSCGAPMGWMCIGAGNPGDWVALPCL